MVELAWVELLGVERPADPLQPLVVFGVLRVREDLGKVAVASLATTVLRWAGPATVDPGGDLNQETPGRVLGHCGQFAAR